MVIKYYLCDKQPHFNRPCGLVTKKLDQHTLKVMVSLSSLKAKLPSHSPCLCLSHFNITCGLSGRPCLLAHTIRLSATAPDPFANIAQVLLLRHLCGRNVLNGYGSLNLLQSNTTGQQNPSVGCMNPHQRLPASSYQ